MLRPTDNPISAADQDELGRTTFVKRLLGPLLEWPGSEGLVVGLFGAWGEGKTSVLNLLESEVNRWEGTDFPRRAISVRFNPWIYRNPESLVLSFFGTLRARLGGHPGLSDGDRRVLVDALNAMGRFAVPLLTATGNPFSAMIAKAATSSAAELLRKGETDLAEQKVKAGSVLTKLSHRVPPIRVVVLIDDLDRADLEEVLAVLKLIRLIADLPNISYLLAMDAKRVRDLLDQKGTEGYGSDFLEKIIQIPVSLPPVARDHIASVTQKALIEVLAEAGLSTERIFEDDENGSFSYPRRSRGPLDYRAIIGRRVGNLRDRARFVNQLRFMLLSGDRGLELNPADAILIAFLHTFFPATYERVRRNREILTGDLSTSQLVARHLSGQDYKGRAASALHAIATGEWIDNATELSRSDPLSELTPNLGRSDDEICIAVLHYLFPYAAAEDSVPDDEFREMRRTNRIQVSDRFDRYFQLEPPPSEASDEMVDRFVLELADYIRDTTENGDASPAIPRPPGPDAPSHESFVEKLADRASSLVGKLGVGDAGANARALGRYFALVEDEMTYAELLHLAAVVTEAFDKGPRSAEVIAENRGEFVAGLVRSLGDDPTALAVAARLSGATHRSDPSQTEAFKEALEIGADRIALYAARGANLFMQFSPDTASHVLWRWRDVLRALRRDFDPLQRYFIFLLDSDSSLLPAYLATFAHWQSGITPVIRGSVGRAELERAVSTLIPFSDLVERCKRAVTTATNDTHELITQFLAVAEQSPSHSVSADDDEDELLPNELDDEIA